MWGVPVLTKGQVQVSVRKWREIVEFLTERGVLEHSKHYNNKIDLTIGFACHLINYKVLPNDKYDRSFETVSNLLARYCPGLNGDDLEVATRITLTLELANEFDPYGLTVKLAKDGLIEETQEEKRKRRAYSTCDLTKLVDNSLNDGYCESS